MSSFKRRVPMLVSGLAVAALLVSCMDRGSAPAIVAPNGPALGYLPPHTCTTDPTFCTGTAAPNSVLWEQLRVCKVYAEGTGPDVEIKLNADFVLFQDGPQTGTITLHSGECKTLWRNGEFVTVNGVDVASTDIITVSETPVPGYATTSQVTTIIRDQPLPGPNSTFTTTVNPITQATSVTTNIGGARIPGALVVFTNSLIPPSCTFTQGYWKNHESAWPAPYSATAQWLSTGHLVNNVTWDGILGLSVAGGNSYMQLAHQWIAATLNAAGGQPVNPAVATALSLGGAWLTANTPSGNTVPFIKNNAQANAWANTLDQFNNGFLGNPHCD